MALCTLFLQGKQKEAEQARIRFAGDTRSDHLALLNAFQVPTVHVLPMSVNVSDKSWPNTRQSTWPQFVKLR